MCPIYVDSRGTGEAEIAELLRKRHLAIEIRHLDSGDYVFGNEVGIERKTINDLIASVTSKDRHLWEQLEVLKNTYKNPLVIIEGPINWKDRLEAGIISSILLGWRLPIIPSYNKEDTANIITALFTKYGTSKTNSLPPIAVRKGKDPNAIRWMMLQCIPGIGPKGAKLLLEAFKDFGYASYDPYTAKENLKKVKSVNSKGKELFYKILTGASM